MTPPTVTSYTSDVFYRSRVMRGAAYVTDERPRSGGQADEGGQPAFPGQHAHATSSEQKRRICAMLARPSTSDVLLVD